MKKEIIKTILPFFPKVRVIGDEVSTELYEQVEKMAKFYGKHPSDFSATFRLLSDPSGENGHFLVSEVIYEKGALRK